jgi:hypothetical protein
MNTKYFKRKYKVKIHYGDLDVNVRVRAWLKIDLEFGEYESRFNMSLSCGYPRHKLKYSTEDLMCLLVFIHSSGMPVDLELNVNIRDIYINILLFYHFRTTIIIIIIIVNRNEYQKMFFGSRALPERKAETLLQLSRLSRQCGIFNI